MKYNDVVGTTPHPAFALVHVQRYTQITCKRAHLYFQLHADTVRSIHTHTHTHTHTHAHMHIHTYVIICSLMCPSRFLHHKAPDFHVEVVSDTGTERVPVDRSVYFRGIVAGYGPHHSDVRAHIEAGRLRGSIRVRSRLFRLEPGALSNMLRPSTIITHHEHDNYHDSHLHSYA